MRDLLRMSRESVLSDEVWARIEPLLPPVKGPMGPPFRPHRPVVEGVIYRLRTGIPWRDLPAEFGAWQTVHRRHLRWSTDGTWDRVLAAVQAAADAGGELDWRVSVDSTIVRVHQHAATAARTTAGRSSSSPSSRTGGESE
jgi:transposase